MSEDNSEDPFENLDDAVGDREGDPFETLDDQPEDTEESSASEQSDPDSAEQFDSEHADQPDTEQLREHLDEEATPERTDDLTLERGLFASAADDTEPVPAASDSTEGAEMEFDGDRREDAEPPAERSLADVGHREGDPFDSFQDSFEEMDVDRLDPDMVWQELTSAESRGSVDTTQERTYSDVSKHSYCEGCEHFSPPPAVSCGHEGTEIVEFLDMETVRVVDCPIVTEREELEKDDGFGDS